VHFTGIEPPYYVRNASLSEPFRTVAEGKMRQRDRSARRHLINNGFTRLRA
jgi:hypothetical protein